MRGNGKPNNGDLPAGWQWKRLDEVCEFLDSQRQPVKASDRQLRIAGKQKSELFPYYGANGQAGWIDDYLFDEPLILLAEDGGAFGSTSKPIAYSVEGKYWVNNHAHVLRPRADTDFDFCLYAIAIRPDVKDLVTGNTRPKLNQAVAASIRMPVPPLAEQKRIAAILKEQLAAVERARAAAEAQLDAAKALPAAYLRNIFDNDEARTWPQTTMGEISISVTNGIYKSAEHYGQGHPFLRMYNIRNDSWNLNLNTLANVIIDDNELSKFALHFGDLLFSRVNSFELVGKCGHVGSEAVGYVFENMLIRVRLVPTVNPLFIAQLVNSAKIHKQIQGVAKRAIGQASINSGDLRSLIISLPPIEIQNRIAAAIDERAKAVERLTRPIERQLNEIRALPGSLLRAAFQGQL